MGRHARRDVLTVISRQVPFAIGTIIRRRRRKLWLAGRNLRPSGVKIVVESLSLTAGEWNTAALGFPFDPNDAALPGGRGTVAEHKPTTVPPNVRLALPMPVWIKSRLNHCCCLVHVSQTSLVH